MDSIVDEPVRGAYGDFSWLRLSGLEACRMFVRGELPAPPIHHLTGITPTETGLGTMTFAMPVTRWLEDSVGIIWGGVYAFLVDAPISMALQTGLPPGKALTTAELSINYLRPAGVGSGRLVARGRTVYLGRDVGVSEATVEDSSGRTMAHATTRCVVLDVPFDPNATLPGPLPPIVDPPDPYLRTPPPGSMLGPSIWDGDRVTTQRRIVSGEIPPAPVQLLTGVRAVRAEEGTIAFSMPASPWFSAGGLNLYGGSLAMLCDTALTAAVWSTLTPDEAAATLDLQVRFLRPVPVDGSPLTAVGTVRHRGRTIRVAEVEVFDAAERRVALGMGSALVIPGGIQSLKMGRPVEDMFEPA
jgi:uncharacterized protein (TIGR00369 family)